MYTPALLTSIAALASTASATGILLPLYVYPSATWNDSAANWKPVFEAAAAHPSVEWLVVVDPQNGPGATLQPGNGDINYISGTAQLNDFANVETIGYVRTDYGNAPMAELKANITAWHGWGSYAEANIAVNGIFFDESSAANKAHLTEAVAFARETFGSELTAVCNFGAAVAEEFYDICDIVVAFESCLSCAGAPVYESVKTLKANIPEESEDSAAIIVHDFVGSAADGSVADAALLKKYVSEAKAYGLGWLYFTSGGYHEISISPATVGANAAALA